MTEKNANPSLNPADNGSFTGVLNTVLRKMMQNTDDMLPARIVAYDRASNRAQVQPMVMLLTTAKQKVKRAQIASVPVIQIGGGGFMLNFNLQAGDMGYIKANDRDISVFLQSMAEDVPHTARMKSFEDGVFIPAIMDGFSIAGEDESNAVFQNLDGSVRVALWSNKVKITAPEIVLDTPLLTVTGQANINGITFSTHRHTGVQTGAGISTGPIA